MSKMKCAVRSGIFREDLIIGFSFCLLNEDNVILADICDLIAYDGYLAT